MTPAGAATPPPHSRRASLAAPLFFSLVVLWMHRQVLSDLGSRLLAGSSVGGFFAWHFWWLAHAWRAGLPLFQTPLLLYPTGAAVFPHAPVLEIPAVLLQSVLNPVAVTNLLHMATYVLTGWTTFLLLRRLVQDGAAALAGAFVHAFSAYMVLEHRYGHVIETALFMNPVYVLCLWDYVLKPTLGNAARAAAAALGVAMCGPYVGFFFGAFFPAAAVAYDVVVGRSRRTKIFLKAVSPAHLAPWAGAAAAAVAAYWPLLRGAGTWLGGGDRFSMYAFSFFVPPTWLVPGALQNDFFQGNFRSEETLGYLGMPLLAILGWAAWKRVLFREAAYRFWLWVACAAAVLCLGPRLSLTPDLKTAVPLPWALAEALPLVGSFRSVCRLWLTGTLAAAALAALALRDLGRPRKPWVRACLAAAFMGFWAWEHGLSSAGTWSFAKKPLQSYEVLRQDPSRFAFLELPNGYDSRLDLSPVGYLYMLYQTDHGKPMVLGSPSRYQAAGLRFTEETPFIYELTHPWVLSRLETDPSLKARALWLEKNGRDALRLAGVKYVLLHTGLRAFDGQTGEDRLRPWLDRVLGPPVLDEGGLHLLYTVYP
jgi:hypothetical protein